MADFPAMPGETQPTLKQLRSNADWASTFGPGETNLARRNAKAAAVEDYSAAAKDAAEGAFMERVASDKDALAYWKAAKGLEQKAQFHKEQMQNAANEFQRRQQKDLADRAAKKAADDLKFSHDIIASNDLQGFSSKMRAGIDSGVLPGTTAYRDLALKNYLDHPNANKDLVKEVFGLAKIKADPEKVLSDWNNLPTEQKANTTFSSDPEGNIKFVARNVTPLEQQRIDTAKVNALTAEEREKRLAEKYEQDRIDAGLPPKAVPAAPAAKSAAPAVGQSMGGYKFKGGNPADKSNWEKE